MLLNEDFINIKTATHLVESLHSTEAKTLKDSLIHIFEPKSVEGRTSLVGSAFFPQNSLNGYLMKLGLQSGSPSYYNGYLYSDEDLILVHYAEGDYTLEIFENEIDYKMEKALADKFYKDEQGINESINNEKSIETLLQEYVDALTKHRYADEEFKGSFEYMVGPKYYKIVHVLSNGQRSAFAFVDKEGNVYKAAGWNTPAKGIRGKLGQMDPSDSLYRRG